MKKDSNAVHLITKRPDMAPLLSISNGNDKVPFGNVSGVPGKDCLNCKACIGTCYALKFYKAWPSVRAAWDKNSALLRSDPVAYFEALDDYLVKKRPEYFRIHVAGDFIGPEHLDNWVLLAELHPATNFLAFTKSFDLLPNRALDLPDNLQIVLSVFPGMDVPKRLQGYSVAYAGESADYADSTHSERASGALPCPGNCGTCGVCWALSKRHLDVRFSIH